MSRWTSLGHASWLAEAGGLRILFDPLLGDLFHGGIHRVHPPRVVHAEALQPDVIVVTHAHPDHFDVPSLAELALRHPDAPVLTADPLVAAACRRLGFRTASVLQARRALPLADLVLLTTPSLAEIQEWGVALSDGHSVVWNQVDSVLDVPTVRDVRAGMAAELGSDRVDLGLVHWSPLREIQAVTAGDLGFPLRDWAEKLAAIAALEAGAVTPAAAGFRHLEPFAWRDAHVFPATEDRLARDLALAAPATRVLPCPPGSALVVEGAAVGVEAGSPLATPLPFEPLPAWVPLAVPEVVDPALGGEVAETVRACVDPWITAELVPAVAHHAARLPRSLRLVLDVALPGGERAVHTFVADAGSVHHTVGDRIDPEHDAVVVVAGSMLADVIEGRRHWGEPLLAGVLRSARRHNGVPVMFPYWALPYRRSVERWVDTQVATQIGRASPTTRCIR
jgi:hypothetical protein